MRRALGRWQLVLVSVIVVQILAIWFVHWIDTRGYLDIEVYRLGGRAVLRGYDLYGDLTPETPDSVTLPFIYPPFAALLFIPFAWMSLNAAIVTISVLSHTAILVTAYVLARSSSYLAQRSGTIALATVALMPLFTLIEPTRETINYGQINLVLMAMCAADFLLPRTRWPRGLLVGIAAGIKLTPLGFLLLFGLRKDWRALAVTTTTFAVTVLIGLVTEPRDSAEWWLGTMVSTGESWGPVYAGNQTLRSLLAKQSLTGLPLTVLWVTGSIVLLAATVLAMRYALRVSNVPLALMLNAMWILLISPISWTHHWVWAGPTLALLFMMSLRHRWYGVAFTVVLCAITVLVGPQWYLPNSDNRELHWTFSQQIVGNAYTLIGIGFLAAGAVAYWRFRDRRGAPPHSPAARV